MDRAATPQGDDDLIRPLLLYDAHHRGGGPRHVRDLAAALRDHHLAEPLVFGVDRLGVADILDIAHYARTFDATHLHSHSKRAALVAWAAAWRTGLPWVHTFHGLHPERYFGWKRWLYLAAERVLAQGRAATIHVSKSQARFADTLGLPGAVIPNGVDADWAHTAVLARAWEPPPDGLPVVAAVGRWDDPVKGLDVLLRATSLSAFRLLLIGSVPSWWREVSRVTAVGEVAEPLNWLGAAEVFLSASWAEGCPYAVLDAMAAGLPVVATRVRGHVDLVVDGMTGRLVNPGDVGALARAIERTLADPNRKAWGERGAVWMRAFHRLEDMALSTRNVYGKAVR